MKLEIISFIFGGILLLVGILGGGFEVRELKIPKVSWAPRLLASIAGLFFILMGVGLPQDSSQKGTNQENSEAETQQQSVGIVPVSSKNPEANSNCDFTIYDELTPNAVSEQLAVLIDGKLAGTLSANAQYPESIISVNVEKPGKYSYSIDGSITFSDEYGNLSSYSCTGQGMINVVSGKRFALAASFSGNTILVTLIE